MLQRIAHPTDFSPEGLSAFEHALALAMRYRCRLDLIHVRDYSDSDHFDHFPHVRDVLQRWSILGPQARVEDITPATGMTVTKVEIRDADAVEGVTNFLSNHLPDLVVMATHGRSGINRWLKGSISGQIARETHVPALLIGPAASSFVDPASGALALNRVLIPVDHAPAPTPAIGLLRDLLGDGIQFDAIHVGDKAPLIGDTVEVRAVAGPVIEAIMTEAQAADLVAMPTAGPHGVLDALRGSTTEQVVQQSPRPVLALPSHRV